MAKHIWLSGAKFYGFTWDTVKKTIKKQIDFSLKKGRYLHALPINHAGGIMQVFRAIETESTLVLADDNTRWDAISVDFAAFENPTSIYKHRVTSLKTITGS